MYYVYILKSLKYNRFYTGIAASVSRRLDDHNKGRVKTTKAYRPWIVVYSELHSTRIEARNREKYFKSGFGREFRNSIMPM